MDFQRLGGEAARIALKDALDKIRRRIDQAGDGFDRHTLRRDWEAVHALASDLAPLRRPRGLACFVGSACDYGRAFPLPWPVRTRCFFEERFVLWPLEQVLDQCERYCVCLTDKDEARVFLYYLGQVEELTTIFDEVPGKVRFPDPFGELEYQRKHVEAFHRHFRRIADALARLYRRETFDHLIVGGHPETLPQFENHLHRCLQTRVVARWHLPVRSGVEDVRTHAQAEEQAVLCRQAYSLWETIQEAGPRRTALGPEEVFRHALAAPRSQRPYGFGTSRTRDAVWPLRAAHREGGGLPGVWGLPEPCARRIHRGPPGSHRPGGPRPFLDGASPADQGGGRGRTGPVLSSPEPTCAARRGKEASYGPSVSDLWGH